MSYTRKDDDLKRYSDVYRVFKAQDGTWEIATRFKKDEFGMEYSVYPFSDTHLGAMVPKGTGHSLARRFPDIFRVHQDALDGVSLIFDEKKLSETAGPLRIRKKKRISDAERARLLDMSEKHSQDGLRAISKLKSVLSQDAPLSQNPAM